MSDIDEESKIILRHLITDLTPKKLPIRVLISIAVFAAKTSIVADHLGISSDLEPFFTRGERYRFREAQTIPPGLFMWFGALERDRKGVFKTRHVMPASRTENHFGLYVFTYAVGHFVLQVVGVKWATYNPEKPLPIVDQNPAYADYMIPFWPITGNLLWPPPKYLSENSVDVLANRWGQLHTFFESS